MCSLFAADDRNILDLSLEFALEDLEAGRLTPRRHCMDSDLTPVNLDHRLCASTDMQTLSAVLLLVSSERRGEDELVCLVARATCSVRCEGSASHQRRFRSCRSRFRRALADQPVRAQRSPQVVRGSRAGVGVESAYRLWDIEYLVEGLCGYTGREDVSKLRWRTERPKW